MPRVTRRRIIELIEGFEPAIAREFLRAFELVRSQARVARVAELIAAGRIDSLLDELGIDQARFSALLESTRSTFMAGGLQGASEILIAGPSGTTVRANWDMRNPQAEAWLRNHSSRFVTAIVEDQRAAIRLAVESGTRLGRNPRSTALDIVGRIGANGRRQGGIVGLTSQQAGFVANAREQLLSGNPERMAEYFSRQRRDRRFDGIVTRAIEAGKPVSAADVDRITARYSDRLLQLRGEMIARTEALTAFNEAREQAFGQMIESGRLRPENVVKVWSAGMDGRTRDTHAAMNGQTVGINEPFTSPSGAQLLHPGDTSFGAPAEEIIACRCAATYKINMIAETLGRG